MTMSKQQTKTVGRIIDTKRRHMEATEAAYATAHAAMVTAEKQKERAAEVWSLAIDAAPYTNAADLVASASELEDRDRYIKSLRRVADHAERNLRAAHMNEAKARDVMTEARIELKRFEKWLERDAQAKASETRRVERIAEDEVATRRRQQAG